MLVKLSIDQDKETRKQFIIGAVIIGKYTKII